MTLKSSIDWIKFDSVIAPPLIGRGLFSYVIMFSGFSYYLCTKLDEGQEKVSGPFMTEKKAKDMAESIENKATTKLKKGAA